MATSERPTWAPIGVVLDVLAQWSRLIIFFLNAHQLFRFGLYRTIRPFRITSRVHPYIKTWTSYFGREKRWLLWDHNSIPFYGSVGTFERRGTTKSSWEPKSTLSIFRKVRKIRKTLIFQRSRIIFENTQKNKRDKDNRISKVKCTEAYYWFTRTKLQDFWETRRTEFC